MSARLAAPSAGVDRERPEGLGQERGWHAAAEPNILTSDHTSRCPTPRLLQAKFAAMRSAKHMRDPPKFHAYLRFDRSPVRSRSGRGKSGIHGGDAPATAGRASNQPVASARRVLGIHVVFLGGGTTCDHLALG